MQDRLIRIAATVFAVAFFAWPAAAQWNSSAPVPAPSKALVVESLRLGAGAPSTPLRLDPINVSLIDSVKADNGKAFLKRLQIGIGRPVDAGILARSTALRWVAVDGGLAARWVVTSPGARALRVGLAVARMDPAIELRFAGTAQANTVYGPFLARDAMRDGATYWSPVLEGESAIVEILVPSGSSTYDFDATIAQVSHLFVSPSDPAAESIAKAAGTCEVDLICRSSSDAALAEVGKAVAKMTFSDGSGGGTFLCTGTLLNPTDGSSTPYFYGANHCISTQASASTLTTHWFYDRTGCGSGTLSASYVQLPGGAQLLYADSNSDAMLMRLNNPPPTGAVLAGWDATPLATGTALTSVHHPEGDVKKVSVGTMGGFGTIDGGSTPTFIISNWNSVATGVTEPGSSGSGLFTATGQPATSYRLRGALYGGPSSCDASASDLHDYYSRFDRAYPSIAAYLSPSASGGGASYEGLWLKGDESGWGVNLTHQGTTLFATWFTYDTDGTGMWLVASSLAQTSAGNFSGALYRTVGPGFNSDPFNSITFPANYTQVGTLAFSFADANNGTMSYTVNGVSQSKPVTRFLFAKGGTNCTLGGTQGTSPNYTDLWLRSADGGSESGWGINITHQGDVLFATWFTYQAGSGSTNKGIWLVMSNGSKSAPGVYSGSLQSTTGPAFSASPFNPDNVVRTTEGSGTFTFTDANSGTFSYTVAGITQSKPIARYTYARPTTVCQ